MLRGEKDVMKNPRRAKRAYSRQTMETKFGAVRLRGNDNHVVFFFNLFRRSALSEMIRQCRYKVHVHSAANATQRSMNYELQSSTLQSAEK